MKFFSKKDFVHNDDYFVVFKFVVKESVMDLLKIPAYWLVSKKLG